MVVKGVEKEYLGGDVTRYIIEFEHLGVNWFKFYYSPITAEKLKVLIQSVVDDTIARCR